VSAIFEVWLTLHTKMNERDWPAGVRFELTLTPLVLHWPWSCLLWKCVGSCLIETCTNSCNLGLGWKIIQFNKKSTLCSHVQIATLIHPAAVPLRFPRHQRSWVIEWVIDYAIFLHELAQQRRSPPKRNLAQT